MSNVEDVPLINTEKISELLSFYKFPLILASIGSVLLIIAIILLAQERMGASDVVFESNATESGKVSSKIKVDIEGQVVNPGVYEFADGERIEDAIDKAGGLTEKADTSWIESNLNRAAKLIDGGKVYIPKVGEVSSQKSAVSSQQQGEKTLGVTTGLININTASQAELETLSGVGPVTAEKIISGRPYGSLDELKSKKIVGNSVFEKIKEKITI